MVHKTEKKRKKQNGTRKIRPAKYTISQKIKIVQEINPISSLEIDAEFRQLRELKCKGAIAASAGVVLGNKIVDFFTMIERLATKGHVGIDFYTFWFNRQYYRRLDYVKNMLKYYESREISEIRKWKYIFNLYFSSISIFRPVMSMEVYCKFRPKIGVLDPTMGWGGRLVGACALDLPKYIGIDSNTQLDMPYREMSAFLQKTTKTKIELFFQDALTVDYSNLDYDMVFTSPPYYNIEVYSGMKEKTKEEWNSGFYKPLFERTWKSMRSPGYYCLNIPSEVYDSACVPILGKSWKKILLKKRGRTQKNEEEGKGYEEYIYIWKK
jgi:hypothetical protein